MHIKIILASFVFLGSLSAEVKDCSQLPAQQQIAELLVRAIDKNPAPDILAPLILGVQIKVPGSKLQAIKANDKITALNKEVIFLGCTKDLYFEVPGKNEDRFIVQLNEESDLPFWEKTPENPELLRLNANLYTITGIFKIESKCQITTDKKLSFSKECKIPNKKTTEKEPIYSTYVDKLKKQLETYEGALDPRILEFVAFNEKMLAPEILSINVLRASNSLSFPLYEKEPRVVTDDFGKSIGCDRHERCEPREDTFDPLDFYRSYLGSFSYRLLGQTPDGDIIIHSIENNGGNSNFSHILIINFKSMNFANLLDSENTEIASSVKANIYLGDRCSRVALQEQTITVAEGSDCKSQEIKLGAGTIEHRFTEPQKAS